MAYDPDLRGVVLFGGNVPGVGLLNDTWVFSANHWTMLCSGSTANTTCPAAPTPRSAAAMTYDYADRELLLYGGCVYSPVFGCSHTSDTWVFKNDTWSNVTSILLNSSIHPAAGLDQMTYDAGDGYVLCYDWNGNSWSFSGDSWHKLTPTVLPSGRYFEALFYDPLLDGAILWGGVNSTPAGSSNETWEYHGGNWTQLHPTHNPPSGLALGGVWDDGTATGTLFGPTSPNAPAFSNSTWRFANGNWTNDTQNLSVAPGVGVTPSMTYDASDGYSVLLTQGAGTPTANQTWILTDPFTLDLSASANVIDAGQSVGYQARATGAVLPLKQTIEVTLRGCSITGANTSLANATCSTTVPGTYYFNVTETDALNRSLFVSASLTVNADPLRTVSVAPNPTTIGRPVALSVSVVLGTPPYAVLWSLGDGVTSNASAFNHVYLSAGTYPVSLSVTDATGFSLFYNLSMLVNAALSVSGSADRTVTDVGLPVDFTGTATGGTAPILYGWQFGDGNGSANRTATHAYAREGYFQAMLNGTDSAGASASDALQIKVNSYPTVQASLNLSTVVAQSPVRFAATLGGGTPPYSYVWYFGNGATNSSASGTYAYPAVGNYTVTLWANDSVGGTQKLQLPIEVTAPPGNPSGPPPATNLWSTWVPWAIVGVIGIGVIGTAVWVVLRRRRNSGPPKDRA